MYVKDNLRGSSSSSSYLFASFYSFSSSAYFSTFPLLLTHIIFLLHILYFPPRLSFFLIRIPLLIFTSSLLLPHLPPLASMPPRIPIFSYSHPFSSLSASSSAFPLLRIPHFPLLLIPSTISLSFFLILFLSLFSSLPFLFYFLPAFRRFLFLSLRLFHFLLILFPHHVFHDHIHL